MKKIFFVIITIILVLAIIGMAILLTWSRNVKFHWLSEEERQYDCNVHGKNCACGEKLPDGTIFSPRFCQPTGIAGCEYMGIWLKDKDKVLLRIKKSCWI